MPNLMIDLETMGKTPNAAIIAIGAVQFDPKTQTIGQKFYEVIDLASSVDAGGVIDADTVIWWLNQSQEAQAALTDRMTLTLITALTQFQKFCHGLGPKNDLKVWGNGAAFDNVILASTFKRMEMSMPWHYWNDCCYRTLKNLYPDNKPTLIGIKHTAIDDALSQSVHLMAILKYFGINI